MENYSYARKAFSRIGIAMCLLEIASNFSGLFLSFINDRFLHLGENVYMLIAEVVPMYVIAWPIAYLVLSGMQTASLDKKKLGAGNLFSFFCISLLGTLIGTLISRGAIWAIEQISGRAVSDIMALSLEDMDLRLSFLITVLLAPVMEELLYRKAIINRTAMFGQKQAIIFSALCFGLAHGNFYQFFYAFLVGIVFGYVYSETGKVIYTIILHALLNFIGGFLPLLIENSFASDITRNAYALLLAVIEVAFYVLGLVFLVIHSKSVRLSETEVSLPSKKWRRYTYWNIGMILFFMISAVLFWYLTFEV